MSHLHKVNLEDKFACFTQTWSPRIVGEVNDFHVKLVKVEGEFVWHHHDTQDELFLILDGEITMHYRYAQAEHTEVFGRNEFLIVPHGVEHKPVAKLGTKLLLLEPKSTLNTGSAENELTAQAVWI